MHTPLSLKLLKKLKTACAQYDPTSPFTQKLLENIAVEALLLAAWKQIAKACLSGRDYLLWKTVFAKQCQAIAEKSRTQQIPILYKILSGEGHYTGTDQQIKFDLTTYVQINIVANQESLVQTSIVKQQTEELSSIKQGPDKLFQDFVSRLTQASNKLIEDSEAGQIII